jgi:ArsR family transcriptional regulator|nr:metalloregulator ArsR/SmtB family transcription factor [uncultured Sphingomonas sp.]
MKAIEVMSALAQPTRLEVFTQLARARPDGLSPGQLAERIGTPASTMSVHLTILSRAGLISSTKKGRSIIYKAEPDAIRDLALFLMHDCCLGCADVSEPDPSSMDCCCGERVRSRLGDKSIG